MEVIKLNSNESELNGEWMLENGILIANDVTIRIQNLVQNHLIKVNTSKSGWEVLYQDPDDERFWLLSYNESHLHGGGAPKLTNIKLYI